MENQINETKILDYLKSKYINHDTKSPTNDDTPKKEKLLVSEESTITGEEVENNLLLNKLQDIQGELSKWLDILRSKL